MSKATLDEFGSLIIRRVRDAAIRDWYMMLDGSMKGELASKVGAMITSFSEDDKKVLTRLIPMIVDTALHHALWTLEGESRVGLCYESETGEKVDIKTSSDGLSGELYSSEGWIAKFSCYADPIGP